MVLDGKKKYVAKIVDDNMYYGPIRSHEIEASKAGHRAGISPKVIYYEKEFTIFEYINSRIVTSEKIRREKNLKKIISIMNIVHKEAVNYLEGANSSLGIFYIIRNRFQILKKKIVYILMN